MRKEFKMTEEQLSRLLESSKSVPYMVIGGVTPLSPRENANAVWAQLGRELGFDWRSVRPINGKDSIYFTAEVI